MQLGLYTFDSSNDKKVWNFNIRKVQLSLSDPCIVIHIVYMVSHLTP